ncbi:MAG: M48 family metallopeptidase [Desulfurivibrionaceae bacterium]
MVPRKLLLCLLAVLTVSGCAADDGFNKDAALGLGVGVLQATTLDEKSVKQTASLAAEEMDRKNEVAPDGSPYATRLQNLTRGLRNYGGQNFDFKVYLAEDVNAFAMADGTVRVFSGLMDAMPDEQVLAVICHEIGHVQLKHSYKQMKEMILTDTAFKAAVSVGGTIGSLTSSQLGKLGQAAVNAHFSRDDELEADNFAVRTLKDLGHDPYAMLRAIETLQARFGSGGGFLSSHPANEKRIANIKDAAERL